MLTDLQNTNQERAKVNQSAEKISVCFTEHAQAGRVDVCVLL